jgi:hypothetical protein
MFTCERCNYTTPKKGNYEKHLLTRKHLNTGYECGTCAKTYTTKSGLWKHSTHCLTEVKDLCTLLLKQQEDHTKAQDELMNHIKAQQKQINDLIPKINPKINLNVFLNDECKDALNWVDFIDMLEIKLYEFELSPTISDHIITTVCNGIKGLGMYKRPIHCTDLKRKKLCIKNENSWEHDSDKIKDTLRKTNCMIQQKYVGVLKQWEMAHPDWFLSEHETDSYTKLASQIMSTIDNEKCALEITKNVSLN